MSKTIDGVVNIKINSITVFPNEEAFANCIGTLSTDEAFSKQFTVNVKSEVIKQLLADALIAAESA